MQVDVSVNINEFVVICAAITMCVLYCNIVDCGLFIMVYNGIHDCHMNCH